METNNAETATSSKQRRLLTSDFRSQEEAARFVAAAGRRFPDALLGGAPSPIPGTWMAFLTQEGVTAYGSTSYSAQQEELYERVRLFAAGYCAGLLEGRLQAKA